MIEPSLRPTFIAPERPMLTPHAKLANRMTGGILVGAGAALALLRHR